MPDEKYNVIFLGLRDNLAVTKDSFRQGMSQLFRVSRDQIDRVLAKAPVILAKNLNRGKAELITSKIESIGGQTKIRIDRKATIQNSEKLQEKTSYSKSKFNLYIDVIYGDRAKDNVTKYLKNIVNKDYTFIKNELLNKFPSKIPIDYSYEEAQKIKIALEEFGSEISIKESDKSIKKIGDVSSEAT